MPKTSAPPDGYVMTELPCTVCLDLARKGKIRAEIIQRLPKGALAPMSVRERCPCCFDCQAADNLLKTTRSLPSFVAARIAVGADRQEQYRLPGVPMGLVRQGIVRPSKKGDLEDQYRWLEEHNWFGIEPSGEPG